MSGFGRRLHPDDRYSSGPNKKPRASAWRMTLCEHCPNVHLLLLDEDGYIFADMTIAKSQRDYFVTSLDNLFDARGTKQ